MDFDILFPDEREKGETPLRQSQFVMLRMLKIMDYLCTKHKIEYFLTGGTLLGAIRHKGFIPWDDDMDVGMTRENYEKFEKIAVPELPNDIFFQTPETDKAYPSGRNIEAKLRDKYSTYSISAANKKAHRWHHGIMIDIFIYDRAYLPHNVFIYALNRTLTYFFWAEGANNRNNNKRAKVLKRISKYSPLPLVYASSFIGKKKLIKLGANYMKGKEIKNLIRATFEDAEFLIPQAWDACLKRQYGDYMKLPSAAQQSGHFNGAMPDPFTPCEHTEVLIWKNRVKHKGSS